MYSTKNLLLVAALAVFLTVFLFSNRTSTDKEVKKNAPKSDTVSSKFEQLSKNGNSYCTNTVADYKTERIQGSCCSPMDLHRYEEQVRALKKYKDIPEIPSDPYDLDKKSAEKLQTYYDAELTPKEQKTYDYAMQHSKEKGPCCCKCWHWYVYGGLAKKLIRERNFTGEQITEIWNLSDGCGGAGDHMHDVS